MVEAYRLSLWLDRGLRNRPLARVAFEPADFGMLWVPTSGHVHHLAQNANFAASRVNEPGRLCSRKL
jgi:hypothetical protein